MRILEQDKNRLVIELRPIWLIVLCVGLFLLFFMLGFGMSYIIPIGINLMDLPMADGLTAMPHVPGMNALGYASVIPLLIAVFLLKTRVLTFNRAAGMITIATRGMLGRSEKTYPLAAFQCATLDRSRSSEGGSTYRAVLQFSDQTGSVPVTPYSTSGPGPSRTVNAINSWFGPVVTAGGADRQH